MDQKLPARASLELLRKRAKARLLELRAERADAKLSDAHFELARAYGFSSWRALKQHVDRERAPTTEAFFKA